MPQRSRRRKNVTQMRKRPRKGRGQLVDIMRDQIAARNIHAELKKFFVSAFNTAYFHSEAGSIKIDLTAVTQGQSGAQRVGDHLYASDLRLYFSIFNGQGATANGTNLTRLWVIQYSQDSGRAIPLVADFLQANVANGNVNTYGALSGYDVDYDKGYDILWDSGPILTYGTNGLATTADCSFSQFSKMVDIPLQGIRDRNIRYTTGQSTGYGHLFLIVLGDQPSVVTNPSIRYNAEFRFSDA